MIGMAQPKSGSFKTGASSGLARSVLEKESHPRTLRSNREQVDVTLGFTGHKTTLKDLVVHRTGLRHPKEKHLGYLDIYVFFLFLLNVQKDVIFRKLAG